MISGTSHCAVQFRWALAWEIIAGAKPQNSPPIGRADRFAPR